VATLKRAERQTKMKGKGCDREEAQMDDVKILRPPEYFTREDLERWKRAAQG